MLAQMRNHPLTHLGVTTLEVMFGIAVVKLLSNMWAPNSGWTKFTNFV